MTAEATVTAEFAGDDTYIYGLEPAVVEVGEEFTMTIRRVHPTDVNVEQKAAVALKDSRRIQLYLHGSCCRKLYGGFQSGEG